MRQFWGFYDNGQFKVGCNGATVYIYDSDNKELDRIKELPYTYAGAFMPQRNIIALKSTDGYLGFYDLEQQKLIKKYRVSTQGAQDEGFAFSSDGAFFYNIEAPKDSIYTQLAIYETRTFTRVKTLFTSEKRMFLESLEFDAKTNQCYVMGIIRNSIDGEMENGFIGILDTERECIVNPRIIDVYQTDSGLWVNYTYISAYKNWEMHGCTQKKYDWSWFHDIQCEEPEAISLKQIYDASNCSPT